MFHPDVLNLITPPPPITADASKLLQPAVNLAGMLPDFNELPERAARAPIEQFYESQRTDFVVNKVYPDEVEIGDRVWAQPEWMYSMEPDVIKRIQPEYKSGQFRFTAVAGVGNNECTPMHYTVPADEHMWVIDWPMYRLVKFADVEMKEASVFMGNLTRGAYVYNGLCWYAYLSPFQRRKVFSSGLFSTMIRNTIKMQIPRAQ